MPETSSNVGSASHLGEQQVAQDSHFIYDYAHRRVPLPIISYLAVADASGELAQGDNPAKTALDRLRDLVEPAVIAEEELDGEHIRALLLDALSRVNESLQPEPEAQAGVHRPQVSLTAALADAERAYIGHVGSTRIYLLHDDRLYNLVPSGGKVDRPVPAGVAAGEKLFDVPSPAAVEGAPAIGEFLGQAPEVRAGYNEVELSPGDVLFLCTDGFWANVDEEEIIENLLSATSVQRSASQLVRLSFSRDATDNATVVAWKYAVEDEVAPRARSPRKSSFRTRAAEAMLIVLLGLVLAGIFVVGFAFGWRITDSFRKPQKEAAKKVSQKKAQEEAAAKQEEEQAQAEQSAPAASAPITMVVDGEGVRMRSTPDATSELVGFLKDGQQVTVLAEVSGSDSEKWYKVKAEVRVSGEDVMSEGYVRNDFLASQEASSTPTKTTP